MAKDDIYTIEYDFSKAFFEKKLEKVLVKQVIYSDGRLFQKFILEGKICWDMRKLIDKIKHDKGIMDMLHWMSPFALYGWFGHDIAITFKKDLVFSKKRAYATINHIINL